MAPTAFEIYYRKPASRAFLVTGEGSGIYRDKRIAALVPAFNEEAHVGGVITTMPEFVDAIVVVDDASTDRTAEVVNATGDARVTLVRHERNSGLGASLVDAHVRALELGGDIMVVMAGDGQMDPAYLPALLDPICDDELDFTKGNRFFSAKSFRDMPRHRIFGNVVLTFLTKAATGYWDVFDPQNGYTALSRAFSERVDWPSVARDYSFENDLLAHLGLAGARVGDVDIPAVYGEEVSGIRLPKVVPSILRTLRRAWWRRIWAQHVVRSFGPVAILGFAGSALLAWSVVFGAWVAWETRGSAVATTGTVMLAVLPFMTGFQMLLAALVLDMVRARQ